MTVTTRDEHTPGTAHQPELITTAGAAPREFDTSSEHRPARPRRGARVAWVVAAIAVLVAAVATWQWRELAALEADRDAVQQATARFMTTLINWDASDGLDDTRDELRAAGTGTFLEEIDELFGVPEVADQLGTAGAISRGEVRDVFTQSLDGDRAVTFVVARQELTTELTDQIDRTVRSARITLDRVGDDWLVSDVELIDDAPTPTGTPDPAASAPPTEDGSATP